MATKTPKTTTPKAGGTPAKAPTVQKAGNVNRKTVAKAPKRQLTSAPQAKPKTGRPSLDTEQTRRKLCQYLMDGNDLRTACAKPGMPAVSTVMRWLHDDVAGFREQYARAREVQAELDADDVVRLADKVLHAVKRTVKGKGKTREVEEVFGDAVDRSRLMVDARKWRASKLAPKRYGDRLALDPVDGASLVVFKDLTGRKDA